MDLTSLRLDIERNLATVMDEAAASFVDIEPLAADLIGHVDKLITAGGGRIRPMLLCLAHNACGAEIGTEALRVASAIELLHTFALIHDDVMDNAATRRGLPSVVAAAGVPVAILAGDLAYALSDHTYWRSGFSLEALVAASGALHRMKMEAMAGQYLDVIGSAARDAGEVAALKTTSYTVRGPLMIGAVLAARVLGGQEPAREIHAAFDGYSTALGQAFQLSNDLSGLFSDPVPNDLTTKANTQLLDLFRSQCEDARLLGRVLEIWGSTTVTESEVRFVRDAVRASGTATAALSEVERLVGESKEHLESRSSIFVHREAIVLLNKVADALRDKAAGIR